MDIALIFNKAGLVNLEEDLIDIQLFGPDLMTNKDLESAVIISLFSDRRAKSDDPLDDDDKKGWWGDNYQDQINYKIGSRLWLLSRAKQTTQTLNRAREYVYECLRWLIDDKVASKLEVEVDWIARGAKAAMGIAIKIYRPGKVSEYNYVWEPIANAL